MTKEELIKDLQRVAKQYHEDFPDGNSYCTRDYYRKYGTAGHSQYVEIFGNFSTFKNKAMEEDKEYEQTEEENNSSKIQQEVEGSNYNIVSTSSNIRTLDELLKFCKVDLTKWKVKKHVINSWGSIKNECFQVKAWLIEKDPEKDPEQIAQDIINTAKDYAPQYKPFIYNQKSNSGNLLEISLYDHHFGQLSWSEETGYDNYDIKIAEQLAHDSINSILSKCVHLQLDKILLTIGNDFFNVNNALNTTVKGTYQSEDDRWKKTYVKGWKLWVNLIEQLMTIAPVDILIVPGNHDGERTFYLGETLYAWFSNCSGVNIDNSPKNRKYYQWGKNLLGFTHGDEEIKGSLVNLMATEQPILWAQSKYREWHKGHFHHAKATAFQLLDEYNGVREWILPSLVALDDWHAKKGYSSLRETMAMVWNKEYGKTDMYFYHP